MSEVGTSVDEVRESTSSQVIELKIKKVANQKHVEEEAMNSRPKFSDCIIFAHLENITVNKGDLALHSEGRKQPNQG